MINEQLLLESLSAFYKDDYNSFELLSILNNTKNISLRSIDWFITNYSKKNNIYYNVHQTKTGELTFDDNGTELIRNINVFQSYKSQLKAYSKRKFDPFCRRNRITFDCNGTNVETTIGQLNFFKWAISNLILEYIVLHKKKIESDMNICLKDMKKSGSVFKKKGERKLRQELSLSATRGLSRTNLSVVLDFD